MKPKNYYIEDASYPFHLSVGAVLRNSEGLIACHYFKEFGGVKDIYILMRETMEPGETIEETLHRGLIEEFGATATITGFVGAIVSAYPSDFGEINKTTLYFLCDLLEQSDERRGPHDEEKDSVVEWRSIADLTPRMQRQRRKYGRSDIDESEVLLRIEALDSKDAQG